VSWRKLSAFFRIEKAPSDHPFVTDSHRMSGRVYMPFFVAQLDFPILIAAVILLVASSAFWIWALVACVKNRRLPPPQRTAWFFTILFLHCLGAALYFSIKREGVPHRAARSIGSQSGALGR